MGSRSEYTIRDEQSWARPIARFLLGCVIAGACLAAIEVLWTVLSPQLPIEALKRQALLPPRSIARFVRSALIVDLGIASAIGLALALPSLFLSKRKPDWALPGGLLFTGTLLVSIFAVVWASLLSPGALFNLSTVLSMGATALPLLLWIALLVAVVRTGRTALDGAMRGLALGALVPLIAASLLHASIPFPNRIARGQADAGLPNLILVTLDTLRADHLAPWSQGSARTPTLSRLARDGVLFERAMSPVPHTTPSHVSMFTSVYPFAHGARNGIPMRTNLATLPTELRKQGYSTAAIVSAYTTKSNVTGMGHAFDTYIDSLHPELEWIARDDIEPLVAARLIDRFGGNQIAAPVINRRLEGWLDRVDGDDLPFFLWLHYFDAHEPYTPTPEYADLYPPADDSIQAKKIARYRAEITYLDDQLGKALDQLGEAGYLDDAVVVVTSDHGEAFGEPHPHIDTSHGAHLYDSVMWVPLIIWGPTRIASNRRIPEQVELLDIAPTLMDLIGAAPPAGFAGRSLSSALTAEPLSIEPSRAFAQTRTLTRPRRLALRTSEWKLVLNPDDEENELFDLRADPGETTDVSNDYPDVVRGFREEIEFISRGDAGDEPRVDDLDPAAIEHLKALGYIDE